MPTIEERTIINLGRGSYVITLHKGWLRYFGLKPGDKVIVTTNGELRVRPKRKRNKQAKRMERDV